MGKFFCNGKKDFCDERLCKDNCEFYDGSGGENVERKTNADRIRTMSDETLALQFVEVVKEAIKSLTDVDLPSNVLDEMRSHFLEKLQQPCEGD